MSEHSPEPWAIKGDDEIGYHVEFSDGTWLQPHLKDSPGMARLVACVNACAGIPTEALEKDGAGAVLQYVMKSWKGRKLFAEDVSKALQEALAIQSLQDKGYTVTPPQKADKGYRWVSPDK